MWLSVELKNHQNHCITFCLAGQEDGKYVEYMIYVATYGVSENSGTPKSSIQIGFSIINHPFWGTPIFGNTHIYHMYLYTYDGGVSKWLKMEAITFCLAYNVVTLDYE